MTFQDARLKLLAYVRNQVRNGEITERRLARLIGISQPHVHNVLKGTRSLSFEIGDLLLRALHLSLLDLVELSEIHTQLEKRRRNERTTEVPLLSAPIGPGTSWPPDIDWNRTFPLPFPWTTVSPDWVMAEIAADSSMTATIDDCDIALLDTSLAQRSQVSPKGLYVVERNGEAVLRYIRPGTRSQYLVTDNDADTPTAWECVEESAAKLPEFVKARIIWLGNEAGLRTPGQRGRILYDPTSS